MIDGLPILDIAPSGLLTLVILFMLTDRLVWHKRLDKLEKVNDALTEQNKTLIEQNGLLLNSSIPTVNAVLNALHQAGERAP